MSKYSELGNFIITKIYENILSDPEHKITGFVLTHRIAQEFWDNKDNIDRNFVMYEYKNKHGKKRWETVMQHYMNQQVCAKLLQVQTCEVPSSTIWLPGKNQAYTITKDGYEQLKLGGPEAMFGTARNITNTFAEMGLKQAQKG